VGAVTRGRPLERDGLVLQGALVLGFVGASSTRPGQDLAGTENAGPLPATCERGAMVQTAQRSCSACGSKNDVAVRDLVERSFCRGCRGRLRPLASTAENDAFIAPLGGGPPRTAFIAPVLARGKVITLLHLDNGPGRLMSPDIGEIRPPRLQLPHPLLLVCPLLSMTTAGAIRRDSAHCAAERCPSCVVSSPRAPPCCSSRATVRR
jgi:hypothetical protein